MAQFSLRKAHRVGTAIEAAIIGRQLFLHTTIPVSTTSSPSIFVESQHKKFKEDLAILLRLEEIRFRIRGAHNKANQERIDALMTERAYLGRLLGHFDEIIATMPFDKIRVEDRLRLAQKRLEAATEGASLGRQHSDEVKTSFLSEKDIDAFKEISAIHKRRLTEIDDLISELNGSIKIEIADTDVSFLQKQRII